MPSVPYIIYGTITDSDKNVVADTIVKAHNTTTNERIQTRIDSDGKYILDLANLTSGYSNGDSITVYVRDNGYTGEVTFTQSGDGGRVTDFTTTNQVTFSTLRNTLWKAFRDTLYVGTFAISESSIYSSMNDKIIETEGYPLVIISPPEISRSGINLLNTFVEHDVKLIIEIYHTSAENVKVLADEVEYQIWRAQEVWDGLGLSSLETPHIDNDWYTTGNKKIHIISFEVGFKYEGEITVP